ncbi:glycosyltransferase family 4 protein [Nakamurella sp.]|uniref:glycosyltransferase family 4 protein n=1 Tax=Nakamurella sp. TaxID=1869182 RepID=UPI00378361E3
MPLQPDRIVVITDDVLAPRMAGPAIRAVHIAEALAAEQLSVELISTARCEYTHPVVPCRYVPWAGLRTAVGDAAVVIFQGFVSYHAPWLMSGEKILVIDLYDPVHLEQLEQLAGRPELEQRATIDHTVRVFNEQMARGDFFLCASELQRALWLGQLAALGRLNLSTYRQDNTLNDLIAVCPFGISDQPPVRTRPAIKGVVPGIAADDRVIIWAGGIYNWFDPLTLIRAVGQVSATHPDIKLFFLGTKHPNPEVTGDEMALAARTVSAELGLTGRHVFFNDGWVDYADRQNYLLDADVGVSTHFTNVETIFSFRTRMLDYLWAGLPMVSTEGDVFGTLIAQEGLGVTVGEGDVDGLAAGLIRTLYDDAFAQASRARVRVVAEHFTWRQALAPLVEFCAAPRRAADLGEDRRRMVRRPVPPSTAIGRRWSRGADLLRQGGPRLVLERARALRRRLRRERAAVAAPESG